MKKFVSCALAACTLLFTTASLNAEGALAIDHNHGHHFGWAVNQRSEREANEKALANCSGDCKIVLNFSHICGAYAADQSEESHAWGWGKRDDLDEAKHVALEECRHNGGRECTVRVFGCDHDN